MALNSAKASACFPQLPRGSAATHPMGSRVQAWYGGLPVDVEHAGLPPRGWFSISRRNLGPCAVLHTRAPGCAPVPDHKEKVLSLTCRGCLSLAGSLWSWRSAPRRGTPPPLLEKASALPFAFRQPAPPPSEDLLGIPHASLGSKLEVDSRRLLSHRPPLTSD